jgi:hypothetical protein
MQGYLCNGTIRNAVPEVSSRNDTSRDGVPRTFFPVVGITITTSLRPNFVSLFAGHSLPVTLCVPELFSKEKSPE